MGSVLRQVPTPKALLTRPPGVLTRSPVSKPFILSKSKKVFHAKHGNKKPVIPAELASLAGLSLIYTDAADKVVFSGIVQNINIDPLERFMGAETGKAVWKGFFYAPYDGAYFFSMQTNQEGKLMVKDTLVLSKQDRGAEEKTGFLKLKKGVYSFLLEMKLQSPALFSLLWGRQATQLEELTLPYILHGKDPRP